MIGLGSDKNNSHIFQTICPLYPIGLIVKAWSSRHIKLKSRSLSTRAPMCTVNVSEEPNCSTNASQLKKSWTGKEQRALEQLLPFFPADPLAIPELCYREQCALYSWQSGAFAAFLCRRPLLQWLLVQLVTPEAFYDQVPISTRKVSNNYWQYSKCLFFNYSKGTYQKRFSGIRPLRGGGTPLFR